MRHRRFACALALGAFGLGRAIAGDLPPVPPPATPAAERNQDNNAFFLESRELATRIGHFMDQTFVQKHFGPTRSRSPWVDETGQASPVLVGNAGGNAGGDAQSGAQVELYFSPE